MSSQLLQIISGALVLAGTTLTGWMTYRASRHNADAQVITARDQVEAEAYDRARRTLEATIDRQDAEIEDMARSLAAARRSLAELQIELADVRAELDAAKAVLALRYPDED